ncbi:MAG: response regulator [Alphaproteobacteria bacterium]
MNKLSSAGSGTNSLISKKVEQLMSSVDVLVVDDSQFTRKLTRNILINIGIKTIYEAGDGLEGLEVLRMHAPDLVILDWEMPMLNGAEFLRIVRSPETFPMPDIPIIMQTSHVERWRVMEANQLGVNEFVAKPVSGKVLLDRIISIIAKPRPMIRAENYYGPEPRKPAGTAELPQMRRSYR